MMTSMVTLVVPSLTIPIFALPSQHLWSKFTSAMRIIFAVFLPEALVPIILLILSDEFFLYPERRRSATGKSQSISSLVFLLSPFRFILMRKTRPQLASNHIDVDSLDLKYPVLTLMQKNGGRG